MITILLMRIFSLVDIFIESSIKNVFELFPQSVSGFLAFSRNIVVDVSNSVMSLSSRVTQPA